MVLRKSDLYRSLWESCDELRGGMDASQYKDYILTLLFVKYVSDKYTRDPSGLIDVPEGGSFADMVALKGDKEIGDKINKIIANLAEANDLQGVIDIADFNDEDKLGRGKEMQDRLSTLVTIFDSLDFRASRADGDDLLGDAYEYLMRHFATESGKSKGQFYTPAEVSRILAHVVGVGAATRQDQTIYDPTCGSGSLLLKAADEATQGITIYGQEMDNATWALAKMNMILHGHPTADLWRGNTLAAPHFTTKSGLKTFDYVVANPPFSAKSWTNGFDPNNDEFRRFEFGVPPAKNGDYAFLLHVVASLKSTGRAAVIMPHGVLFRGNAEASIRKKLITNGLIEGVIGLPANLFYGTGIPACILVIDKAGSRERDSIFVIDASRGFRKDGNKNRLRERDIHKIVDVFTTKTEISRYSRLVPVDEISNPRNDFNLNIPRYVDSSDPEDLHDLEAHLRGGIPQRDIDALEAYWEVMSELRGELFEQGDRPGYMRVRVEPDEVRQVITTHHDFRAFRDAVAKVVKTWTESHRAELLDLGSGSNPKELITTIADDLLRGFGNNPLLDPYDMYQRLMDYWNETMQDDAFLVTSDGWVSAARPRPAIDDKERKIQETPDLVVNRRKYKTDLIPPNLLAKAHFPDAAAEVERLGIEAEAATAALEAFVEEHGDGDEALLSEVLTDKGKVTKTAARARLRALDSEQDPDEERSAIEKVLSLLDAESVAKAAEKSARETLDNKTFEQYGALTDEEVKSTVVDRKWLTSIEYAMDSEASKIANTLSQRLRRLAARYSARLPDIESAVGDARRAVEQHLQDMGLTW